MDFEYSKDKVTQDMKEIEISYSEDGILDKANVPILVTKHIHEWGEWTITKEPTQKEEGQKERICLKNKNHKEIVKIDKLPEVEDKKENIDKNDNTNNINNIDKTSKNENDEPNKIDKKNTEIMDNTVNTDNSNEKHTNTENAVNSEKQNKSSANPKTGDNLVIYIITLIISIIGFCMSFVINKKNTRDEDL